MIANLEALKRACPLKEVVVGIPGTDETILLRELTLADRADHLERNKETADFVRSAAFLVARSCPSLTDADIDGVASLGFEVVKHLSQEVLRISGMLVADAVEEEVKN
jgi:hypothetical protein